VNCLKQGEVAFIQGGWGRDPDTHGFGRKDLLDVALQPRKGKYLRVTVKQEKGRNHCDVFKKGVGVCHSFKILEFYARDDEKQEEGEVPAWRKGVQCR